MNTANKATNLSPVIFLDFDGVLQTPALGHWIEMEHTDALEQLVAAFPELGIVVTSTHREGRSLAELRLLLPESLRSNVIGATEVTALGRAAGGRQREIEQWLQAHPWVTAWVAVDDEQALFRETCDWLVLTHKWIGWDELTTAEVVRRLGLSRIGKLSAPEFVSRLADEAPCTGVGHR